ncbi:MAG: YqeG family HAD IIIA-type phosphatase [Clostridia bacterium]|nr:YqeG family HAD IIIA-type phosphatase [Clostridia bacterium]
MMKNFYPDLYLENISCITASMLSKMGMEAVVLDVDNTLVPHNDPHPTKEVEEFLADMRKGNIKICVVSNNTYERVKPFCDKIGIEYFVHDALKPRAYGYLKAAEIMGVEAIKTVGIGDQIFTDVWGGNRAGCYTILLKPIDISTENPFIKFKRLLEKPFLKKIKRSENK